MHHFNKLFGLVFLGFSTYEHYRGNLPVATHLMVLAVLFYLWSVETKVEGLRK